MVKESWEERIDWAERHHERRRRRAARVFRTVEGVFFAALVLLTILILMKFGTTVLPEYFQ